MDLILWRHAQAEDASTEIPDSARRLTPKGIKQAKNIAIWLERNLTQNCRIIVSPSTRTRQTVAALDRKFNIIEELAPGASADDLIAAANWPYSKESVMIVGHQPSLGELASRLITPFQAECAIRKGNVWWISQRNRDEGGQAYLKAIMPPDLVLK